MNRREFVRAALLAGAGAACGVRAASPAPDPGALQLARMWGKPIVPTGLMADDLGADGLPIVFSREALAGPDVLGPLLDEMRQNMCDALDEEWATGRWG